MPDSKVDALLNKTNWHDERRKLRDIILACGLTETVKWNQLCYTHEGANVVIIFCLKDYCGPGFFKGSLLDDPDGVLYQQTENAQATRLIRFTSLAQITQSEKILTDYIHRAIAVEKAGLKVDFKAKHDLDYPAELLDKIDQDPAFKTAFEALTPGRQRGYMLHFTGAKQSKTRAARIEKARPGILAGKGMQDR